jgi:hypothetical protein
MTKLVSDSAQVEISHRVKYILRSLAIDDWQSEPYQQHQNPAERHWQTAKHLSNTLLARSGFLASTWLLCLLYVCYVLNHMWSNTLQAVPLYLLTGSTPDISPLLRFYWWQPVYYLDSEAHYPSSSNEK